MIVKNNLLSFGGPIIYQDTNLFNFSIDSLLLASFVKIKKNDKSIIDLGTGNAPIPLYLSLRTNVSIYGIEIQKESYDLAIKNIIENKKDDQIKIINDDIKNISKKINKKFDIVVSNPPFYKIGEFRQNENQKLNIARHEILITLDDLVKESYDLLNDGGYFYMIHRPNRLADIIDIMKKNRIYPYELVIVCPKSSKSPNHILISGIKNRENKGFLVNKILNIYDEYGNLNDVVKSIYSFNNFSKVSEFFNHE